jgi:hypothetical protein
MAPAIRFASLTLAFPLALASHAASAAESRLVTEAEEKAFTSFYQQQFPKAPPPKPVFTATRDNPAQPWSIAATVDSPPQRGLGALCRLARAHFNYAAANRRWSAGRPPRPYAWMERAGCRNTHQAVEMLDQLPDSDVLGLLEHRFELMQAARILLGGNSACAIQRAYRFNLAQIKVGTAGPSPEILAGLVFKSDHNTFATVWARRSGADYSAWNVSCP